MPKNQCSTALEKKVELLRRCLEHMNLKTTMLTSNDLAGLEASSEIESALVQQLAVAETEFDEQAVIQALGETESPLHTELRLLVAELRVVNTKHAVLVRNGREFVETLMEALHPGQTYSPSLQRTIKPPELKFSLTC